MPFVNFETIHRAILAAEGAQVSFRLGDMWLKMGPFARAIAGVLAVMSVYSLAVMAERLVAYARAGKASRLFAARLGELLPAGKYQEAADLAKALGRGHLTRVLGLALEEWERGRRARETAELDVVAAVNRSIERSSIRTIADLRRGLGALATIGSTAPFVGLLGTVAGIMSAFEAMAATGSGGLASVSAGIAEALVTTAFGLLVAIPAVMMFNHLTGRVEDMEVDINDAATELVDHFIKQEQAAGGKPAPARSSSER
jgi:biopolymer transport protein ExbB/TolQ